MAIYYPSIDNKSIKDLDFIEFPKDAFPHQAWSVASGDIIPERVEKGREDRQWLFIDVGADEKQVEYFFTMKQINTEPNSVLEFITILVLNEQRAMFFYSSDGTEFAPVHCDPLWTPTEDMIYREVRDGEVEKAIWEVIIEKNEKDS